MQKPRKVATLKSSDTRIIILFTDGTFIDKLATRNIKVAEDPNSLRPMLYIDLSHYSKIKRNNLEGTDFEKLVRQIDDVKAIILRDQTVAKEIVKFNVITEIDLNIGDDVSHIYSAPNQKVDRHEARFEF